MEILFDLAKNECNKRDHGIDFEDAKLVLSDPFALVREDDDAEGEQRFVALGGDAMGRVLIVAYTYRRDHIRLISAWKANRQQRRRYEENRIRQV